MHTRLEALDEDINLRTLQTNNQVFSSAESEFMLRSTKTAKAEEHFIDHHSDGLHHRYVMGNGLLGTLIAHISTNLGTLVAHISTNLGTLVPHISTNLVST